ncbi:hypothetical protein ACFFRR_001143 [Megaselia abdita]
MIKVSWAIAIFAINIYRDCFSSSSSVSLQMPGPARDTSSVVTIITTCHRVLKKIILFTKKKTKSIFFNVRVDLEILFKKCLTISDFFGVFRFCGNWIVKCDVLKYIF